MRIIWTEPALRDLSAARAYIVTDNSDAADKQVEYVMTAILGLARFPESGRPGRRTGTRELVIGKTPFIALSGEERFPRNLARAA